jgi:subtilisin family serine protease
MPPHTRHPHPVSESIRSEGERKVPLPARDLGRSWAGVCTLTQKVSAVVTQSAGLNWAYNKRATIDVVNMSLSADAVAADQNPCGPTTTPLHNAICRVVNEADIPVIVAAGNQGRDASTKAPATYDEVITVSAFADVDGTPGGDGGSCDGEGDDTFASFSNDGADIDIAAPGVCIRSTWLNGTYKAISGTSMATPHVTGAVALYLTRNPNATVVEVRAWIGEGISNGPASRPHPLLLYGFTGDRDAFDEGVLYLGLNPV